MGKDARAALTKLTRNRGSNEGNTKAIASSRAEPLASLLTRIAVAVGSRTTPIRMPSWDPPNDHQIPSMSVERVGSEPTSPPVKAKSAEQEYHDDDDQ